MKPKIAAIFAILLTALMLLAQDTAQIFSEIAPSGRESEESSVSTVSAPVATPAIEPIGAPVVMPAESARPAPAVVEVAPVAAVPVVVEAAPAAVTPAVAPVVTPAAPAVVEATPAAATAGAAPEDVVETVIVSAEPATGGTIKAGLISVSLKEVELSNVIRLFATLSDANIIIPELEAGAGALKIDVNLKEVEWKPALQSILETQGFELYEKTPGTAVYSVRKKPADAPQPMDVKIFKLNYASVSNVYEMIRSIVPEKGPLEGKISTFPSRNTIIVQSTPENLMNIQQMIAAIDLPRQQVFIEAKIMELSDIASEQLGIDWQVLGGTKGGYSVGLEDISGAFKRTTTKTETEYRDIADRRYESVTAPVDYGARPGSFGADETRISGITPTTVEEENTTTTLGATLSADDFNLVLAALKEINGIKLVSNPKVIVANEENAKIYIGRKEPNIKQDTTQAQQADAVTTFNLDPNMPWFEYGIKLDVTPVVNTSSNISVTISPTISRKFGDKEIEGGGSLNSFPILDEKTINTVFSLESGQTAAIGGLTELDSRDADRKIPLLGSIPLIGRLFSYSNMRTEQKETVIFVTVGLANPDHISMETGLPQDSTLAMRQDATMRNTRQISIQKQKLLETQELERAQKAVEKLQKAEQKRLEKKNK